VPLPTIRIKDIAKDGKGATPEEVATQIMDAVLKGAQNAVASAKINVDKLTGAAMEQVEKATGAAMKQIEEATGGAGDTVKGLIKGSGK
jgi:dihydroneopterin aldolase